MRAKEMDSYRMCVADSSDVLSRCSILHCQHSFIDQLPSSLSREGRHEGERRHVEDNGTCTYMYMCSGRAAPHYSILAQFSRVWHQECAKTTNAV